MANPDNLSFFYLQKGPLFTDDYDVLTTVWSDMRAGHCVVPESVRLDAGAEPGKLVFRIYADSQYAGSNIFPPVASLTTTARRPDGNDGNLTLPAYEGDTLKPFTMIRLLENPDEATVTEGVVRFVGVLLTAQLDLTTDTWLCSALEIPRWRMSKYTVRGILWHNTNREGNVPPDPVNPMVFRNLLPVFNADGKRDMFIDAILGRQLEFYHPDFKYSSGYLVDFWRPGDVLNYLRKCWWEIDPATGLTILGVKGLSEYLEWPEVTEVTHPWLFVADTDNQVLPDLPLGTLSLLDAIDTVIRKAGKGSEWTVSFYDGTLKWTMEFYNRDGISDVTLVRGKMGGATGESAQVSEGSIGYDWTLAADNITIFGREESHEVTIAYDPNNVMMDYFPNIIKPDWDSNAQTNYQSAEQAGSDAAKTDFPGVFTRFRFREDEDWDYAFHGANYNTTRQGQREFLGEMVSKVKDGSGEIMAKVWRWTVTDEAGAPHFTSQPETVGLIFNRDGSFSVHGYDETDKKIPLAISGVYPRYLCNVDPAAPEDPWTTRAFILVLSVAGDTRSIGNSAVDPPDGWPDDLQDTPDISKLSNQWRYNALHFVDAGGLPIEDNPVNSARLSFLSPEKIKDVDKELNAAAVRRRQTIERPICEGMIVLGGHPDWDIVPGKRIENITGGAEVDVNPPLPEVSLGILIKNVTFLGLGTRGISREQRVEVGNG